MRASSVVRRVLTSGRAGACQAFSRARRARRWESCFETEFPSADVMRAALRARCEGGIRGMATWLSLRGAPSAPPAWPGSNPSSPSKKRAPVIGAARPALARAPVAVTASAHVSGGGGGGGGGAPQALGAAGGAAPGVLVPAPCAPVPLQQTGAFVSAPGAGYPGMAVGLGFPGMVPGGSAPPQQLAAPPQQLAAGAVLQAGPPQQAGVPGQALAARSAHGSLELQAGAQAHFGGQPLHPRRAAAARCSLACRRRSQGSPSQQCPGAACHCRPARRRPSRRGCPWRRCPGAACRWRRPRRSVRRRPRRARRRTPAHTPAARRPSAPRRPRSRRARRRRRRSWPSAAARPRRWARRARARWAACGAGTRTARRSVARVGGGVAGRAPGQPGGRGQAGQLRGAAVRQRGAAGSAARAARARGAARRRRPGLPGAEGEGRAASGGGVWGGSGVARRIAGDQTQAAMRCGSFFW